jgi:glyoxylase-like metal-dependent hydrolase (beta-lactamase superfamily II)
MADDDRPAEALAEVHILFSGYAGERVASTVAFVREGERRVIVDPGMVPDRRAVLEPLAALGVAPEEITDGNARLLPSPQVYPPRPMPPV